MKLSQVQSTIGCALVLCAAKIVFSQSPARPEDGSRTVYEFDDAQHKAIATTTGEDGKLREKIHYDVDEAGRFSSGTIFGPDGHLRFKSLYKYDSSGRLQEETQNAESGTLLHKIVYTYDQTGKRTGYSIFDTNGKLVGRTVAGSPSPKRKK